MRRPRARYRDPGDCAAGTRGGRLIASLSLACAVLTFVARGPRAAPAAHSPQSERHALTHSFSLASVSVCVVYMCECLCKHQINGDAFPPRAHSTYMQPQCRKKPERNGERTSRKLSMSYLCECGAVVDQQLERERTAPSLTAAMSASSWAGVVPIWCARPSCEYLEEGGESADVRPRG